MNTYHTQYILSYTGPLDWCQMAQNLKNHQQPFEFTMVSRTPETIKPHLTALTFLRACEAKAFLSTVLVPWIFLWSLTFIATFRSIFTGCFPFGQFPKPLSEILSHFSRQRDVYRARHNVWSAVFGGCTKPFPRSYQSMTLSDFRHAKGVQRCLETPETQNFNIMCIYICTMLCLYWVYSWSMLIGPMQRIGLR